MLFNIPDPPSFSLIRKLNKINFKLFRKLKIAQFKNSFFKTKNVFNFYVIVAYIFFMQVFHCFSNLSDHLFGVIHRQILIIFIIKFPIIAQSRFHEKSTSVCIHILVLQKALFLKFMNLYDIWMVLIV